MKYGYKNRYARIYINLPWLLPFFCGCLWGWSGFAFGSAAGFFLKLVMLSEWPQWATDLEWDDLELAVKNVGKLSTVNGTLLIVVTGCRRVDMLRERFYNEEQPFGIVYDTCEWASLIDLAELRRLIAGHGGGKVYRKGVLKKKLYIVPQEAAVDTCFDILRYFIEHSAGGLASVRARERLVNRSVWVSAEDQQKSPVPLVECNFLGKRNGMTIFRMPSGEKKIITPEGIVDYVDEASENKHGE